jgi:hypothetical protein
MLAFAFMNFMTGAVPLTLVCHPRTPSEAIEGIHALVGVAPDNTLTLLFALQGDLSCLRIPDVRSSGRADGLWRHTCFEAFVMADKGPGYREFNLSPSGEWAAYDFRGYRDGGALESASAPTIVVRRMLNRLELEAQIDRDSILQGRSLRLGLSAVVEDTDGARSYWALQHPPGEPDFHHAESFTLQPGPPGMPAPNRITGGAGP